MLHLLKYYIFNAVTTNAKYNKILTFLVVGKTEHCVSHPSSLSTYNITSKAFAHMILESDPDITTMRSSISLKITFSFFEVLSTVI